MTSTRRVTADKTMSRGDDKVYNLTVREPQIDHDIPGTLVDLTGSLITYTLKLVRADGGAIYADPVIVKKTSDDTSEILILDQTTDLGRADIYLRAADTKFLAPGVYAYDVQVRTAAGKVYTVAKGRLYLEGDVTAAEDITAP